jgi:hypothetical protein
MVKIAPPGAGIRGIFQRWAFLVNHFLPSCGNKCLDGRAVLRGIVGKSRV